MQTEALLTSGHEVAECEAVMNPELTCERRSVCHGDCESLTHIILGQPVAQLDVSMHQIYVCRFEDYLEVGKYVSGSSIVQMGSATSQVCAGSGCQFVLELGNPVCGRAMAKKTEQSLRKAMCWFAVMQCDVSFIDALVKVKLKGVVNQMCFQRGLGKCAESSLLPQGKFCVNVIAAGDQELKEIFPGMGSSSQCLLTSIRNALKVSRYIRIGPSIGNRKLDELITMLANSLHSFYQTEVQVKKQPIMHEVSTEPHVPLNGFEGHQTHGASVTSFKSEDIFLSCEMESKVEVDYDGFDIKQNIIERCEGEHASPGSSHILETTDDLKYDCVLEEEEEFPATPKPCIFRGRRLLLECPTCSMTFRSSRNRYQTLVLHIKRRHSDCQKRLLRIVKKKYGVGA